MPHIVIDNIKEISYPKKLDNVEFLFKAENLIGIKTESAKFLIKIIKKDNGYLIKYDKITRPLISEIKKAYLAFVKLNNAKILFENINGIKEKLPDKNLINITDDLRDIDIVEIGFGSGRHLLYLAKENPWRFMNFYTFNRTSIKKIKFRKYRKC